MARVWPRCNSPSGLKRLNKDFRDQLTVMGQFAQAIVADEVANHPFRIKTDKPNVKVSWQVTGSRQDAFANAHRIRVVCAGHCRKQAITDIENCRPRRMSVIARLK